MNKNVLANVAGMISKLKMQQSVKQVTLNVIDNMNKINTVSSQAVLKESCIMDTCSKSSSPLVNSLVINRLFKTTPDIDELPFRFIHTVDLSLVDMMLRDTQISYST